MHRLWWGVAACVLLVAVAVGGRQDLYAWAFAHTGEEEPLSQARALIHLGLGVLREPLDLRADIPIRHTGVNPFGMNTFLQQEVEPQKRTEQVRLIAAAGFGWIRQEFPWQDIEIAAKGDFSDCRNTAATGGCISSWLKYDQIMADADTYGLRIVARLSSPPAWSRADGEARGSFAPPDRLEDFADFAAAVAEHYRGRITAYQIWNEPNIYPEWGNQPADPEAYTALLCAAYRRLKTIDPDIIVLSAPLAPTLPLGLANPAQPAATDFNDLIFLERMYAAGAGDCFDVMSVQGYGLNSAATDERLRPLQFNTARNLLIRDMMVRHGDAAKALWISEINWNAAPAEVATIFGRFTEEQQARYAPLAYERMQTEWPWVGNMMFWFFKRASDAEKDQAWYYFRMADPDFTLRPVYAAMKDYIAGARYVGPGWYQEGHWALDWSTGWRLDRADAYTFGEAERATTDGATLDFDFVGAGVRLETLASGSSTLLATLDGRELAPISVDKAGVVALAHGLPFERHHLHIVASADVAIDGIIVERAVGPQPLALAGALLALLILSRAIGSSKSHE